MKHNGMGGVGRLLISLWLLAAIFGIPGARFVALQGQNHLFLENEPAAHRFFEEIKLFLGQ